MTLAQAKSLSPGDVLHHVSLRNADGSPQRWRVNGRVKTWKRDCFRIHVPLKRGLYSHGYLDESNINQFSL
jgi:hypothetical protein